MGKELKISSEKLNDLVKQANEMNEMVTKAIENAHMKMKDDNGNKMDKRDLTDLALSFVVSGNTPEEKQADMDRQVKEMADAFQSGDMNRKKPYLDKMYDLLDNVSSFYGHEITEPEEFNRLLSCCALNQAYATKRDESTEYYLERYNTVEKKLKKTADYSMSDILGGQLEDIILTKAPNLKHKAFNPISLLETAGYDFSFAFTKALDGAVQNGSKEILFDLPTSYVDKIYDEYPNKKEQLSTTVETPLLNSDSSLNFALFVGQGNNNRFLSDRDPAYVFIGDKSLEDLAKEELLRVEEYASDPSKLTKSLIGNQAEHMFRRALMWGDEVVSFVIPQWDGEKLKNTIFKVKPNVEKFKDDLRKAGKGHIADDIPTKEEVDKIYNNTENLDATINSKFTNFMEAQKNEYFTLTNPTKETLTFKNDDIIKEGIKKFDEVYTLANNAAFLMDKTYNLENAKFDRRDLRNIAYLFDIQGESIEEKQADMNRQMEEMTKAFISDDPEQKKKYLDLLWSSFEKSKLGAKRDVQTADEVKLLLVSSQLIQTINTKAMENKEEFFKHFAEVKDYNFYLSTKLIHEDLDAQLQKMYETHEHKNDIKFMVTPKKDYKDRDLCHKFALNRLDIVHADKTTTVNIKIPGEYNDLDKKDLHTRVDIMLQAINEQENFSVVIQDKYKSRSISEKDYRLKMFFLNNEDLATLAEKELRKTKEYKDKTKAINKSDLNEKAVELMSTALMKGDKTISYVSNCKTQKGSISQVVKIKPELSEVREAELSKHTWFRRTFFNWGIFKIDCPPKQEKIDAMYKNAQLNDNVKKADSAVQSIADEKIKAEQESDRKLAEMLAKKKENNLEKNIDAPQTTEELRKSIGEITNQEIKINKTSVKVEQTTERDIKDPYP